MIILARYRHVAEAFINSQSFQAFQQTPKPEIVSDTFYLRGRSLRAIMVLSLHTDEPNSEPNAELEYAAELCGATVWIVKRRTRGYRA